MAEVTEDDEVEKNAPEQNDVAQDTNSETLSQDEIDELLGFGAEEELPTVGIDTLLNLQKENYERLPMLEVVFDRFIRSLSTSLRNLTGENVEINVEQITSLRFEDYLNSVPLPALLEVFYAVEWDNYGLITIDSSLTYSMVDILFGGSKGKDPLKIDGRAFTKIEQDVVKLLTRTMMDEMETAFNPLTSATFKHERLESNPSFATIVRPTSPVTSITIRIYINERVGVADIMLPYDTIEPIKDLLTQMFSGESFGSESSWESYLRLEVKDSATKLEAHLTPKKITIKELANLQVGSTITLNNKPNETISLKCKGIKILDGHIGSSNKNVAIRVTKPECKKEAML